MPNPAHADQIALAYLGDNGVTARRDHGWVVCDNGVRIKVLYSTPRRYGKHYRWTLPYGLVCDVLMLIAFDGARYQHYLFDPSDAAFYYADERQKQFVTWYPERVAQRHHEQRYEALTSPVMAAACDRLDLIEAARHEK